MYKNATKCNETIGKWCKNKHRASKIIDTFETYHQPILSCMQPCPAIVRRGLPGFTASTPTLFHHAREQNMAACRGRGGAAPWSSSSAQLECGPRRRSREAVAPCSPALKRMIWMAARVAAWSPLPPFVQQEVDHGLALLSP
jgi:hypothetical protein